MEELISQILHAKSISSTMDNSINQIQNKRMKIHKCEICDKEFKSKNSLHTHIKRIHDEQKRKMCNICLKAFSFESELSSHLKIVHENKKYHKCDSCDKSFSKAKFYGDTLM